MRFFILIALCFALANATFWNKNRFQRLLNRYQNRYDTDDDNVYGENLYGSDDVDDYIDDYVNQIRRDRMYESDQCPRNTFGLENWNEEECETTNCDYNTDFEDIQGRGRFEDIMGERDSYDTTTRGTWYEDQPQYELLKELSYANTKLACRLYEESKDERDDKNTVVSPLSIQLALAALKTGTRGTTKRQIERVIGGHLQTQECRRLFKTIIRTLKGYGQTEYSTGRKCHIKPVTGIFVSQTTPAQQMFVQMIKTTLGATVKHCNFHRQPQQCRQIINQWMAQRTQGKLTQIVPRDAVTDNTKLIIVNSMNVKATWGPQMRQHVTKEAKFYPLDTKKVKIVEVMETKGKFKYHEDELVKIVGIPTQQKELTLYVIVPKEKDGLTEVEKLHLQDGVQLKQLLSITDRRVHHVGVQLPKFQIKHKIDVRRTLRKQGVVDIFDPLRADLSGITGISKYQQDEEYTYGRNSMLESEETMGNWQSGVTDTKLHLNKFIHQSTIKITENGITAITGSGNDFEDTEEYGRTTRFGRFGGLDDIERFGGLDTGRTGRWENLEDDEWNMFNEFTGFNRRELTGTTKVVKANHAFAFVLKHNPTNQLIFVGRVIDAAQKKINHVQQTINVVDQL